MLPPRTHPRYASLAIRERLVEGFRSGIVVPQGLLAHGRGEAFDYLLGEATQPFAERAMRAGVAWLLTAARPVISVNGNVAALAPEDVAGLSRVTGAVVEVNLFHRTEERVARIAKHLEAHGCTDVLGTGADAQLPFLDHARAVVHAQGIFSADVVLVPLEDGDRAEALARMGKTVLAMDLNPMSRTAVAAAVTVVDNVVRAIPRMAELSRDMRPSPPDVLERVKSEFDNRACRAKAVEFIRERGATPSEVDIGHEVER